ncbi:hypothetical protein H696_01977 [Fonticula alba]|uniref:Uncharacterized protein n=1 Tax=Fonticula alba TaxID=691883 RepID=A0A058Z9X8_FONAL|nr:hypothetical protein H696_01977 [Fonticula alba]KCV71030.1 hypothetical protein H696_01977 [Fonticula alba]|eukprot:XP_009494153.1 hypothetical protein H696_01977 [Fonticula alba]
MPRPRLRAMRRVLRRWTVCGLRVVLLAGLVVALLLYLLRPVWDGPRLPQREAAVATPGHTPVEATPGELPMAVPPGEDLCDFDVAILTTGRRDLASLTAGLRRALQRSVLCPADGPSRPRLRVYVDGQPTDAVRRLAAALPDMRPRIITVPPPEGQPWAASSGPVASWRLAYVYRFLVADAFAHASRARYLPVPGGLPAGEDAPDRTAIFLEDDLVLGVDFVDYFALGRGALLADGRCARGGPCAAFAHAGPSHPGVLNCTSLLASQPPAPAAEAGHADDPAAPPAGELFCVSAWNDRSYPGLAADPGQVLRTSHFAGMGFMLTGRLGHWLLDHFWPLEDMGFFADNPHFPGTRREWDDLLRAALGSLQGLAARGPGPGGPRGAERQRRMAAGCLVPEVPRTGHTLGPAEPGQAGAAYSTSAGRQARHFDGMLLLDEGLLRGWYRGQPGTERQLRRHVSRLAGSFATAAAGAAYDAWLQAGHSGGPGPADSLAGAVLLAAGLSGTPGPPGPADGPILCGVSASRAEPRSVTVVARCGQCAGSGRLAHDRPDPGSGRRPWEDMLAAPSAGGLGAMPVFGFDGLVRNIYRGSVSLRVPLDPGAGWFARVFATAAGAPWLRGPSPAGITAGPGAQGGPLSGLEIALQPADRAPVEPDEADVRLGPLLVSILCAAGPAGPAVRVATPGRAPGWARVRCSRCQPGPGLGATVLASARPGVWAAGVRDPGPAASPGELTLDQCWVPDLGPAAALWRAGLPGVVDPGRRDRAAGLARQLEDAYARQAARLPGEVLLSVRLRPGAPAG